MRGLGLWLTGILFVASSVPLLAHHSFAADCDASQSRSKDDRRYQRGNGRPVIGPRFWGAAGHSIDCETRAGADVQASALLGLARSTKAANDPTQASRAAKRLPPELALSDSGRPELIETASSHRRPCVDHDSPWWKSGFNQPSSMKGH